MSAAAFEPEITEVQQQPVALLRDRVRLDEMGGQFSRALGLVGETAGMQGVQIAGPPVAVYYSMEDGVADVGIGFPVDRPVAIDGESGGDGDGSGVQTAELPGGRAVQVVHRGPYDELSRTYERLMDWMREQQLQPGAVMWESYLNEPDPDAPDATLTQITWPLA